MEFTVEKSQEQAQLIKLILFPVRELDIEYLEHALAEMKKTHSMRDAAAVLNPNPFMHHAQQDLNAAKLKQLSCLLELAKNYQKIVECTEGFESARASATDIGKLFGN